MRFHEVPAGGSRHFGRATGTLPALESCWNYGRSGHERQTGAAQQGQVSAQVAPPLQPHLFLTVPPGREGGEESGFPQHDGRLPLGRVGPSGLQRAPVALLGSAPADVHLPAQDADRSAATGGGALQSGHLQSVVPAAGENAPPTGQRVRSRLPHRNGQELEEGSG